jgi:ketosteroid isomerase-like protein
MVKNEALETVGQYFKFWSQKDYNTSRTYLADDLYFKGPFDTFQRADDLIQALSRLAPIMKEIRSRKILCDDRSVFILYDMVTSTPAGTVPIAEVFEVASGKITSILAFFDPRPFVPLFGRQ